MKKIIHNHSKILKTGILVLTATLVASCKSGKNQPEQSEYISSRSDKQFKSIKSLQIENSVEEAPALTEMNSVSEPFLELQNISDFLARMNAGQVSDDEKMVFWKQLEETNRLDQLLRSYEAELTTKDWFYN